MKPFLVHYTFRERDFSVRVLAATEAEARGKFRLHHPNGTIRQVDAPAPHATTLVQTRTAPPRPAALRFTRQVSDAERVKIAEAARRLTADLRARLFPEATLP